MRVNASLNARFPTISPRRWGIAFLLFVFFTTLYFATTVGIMNSGDAPQFALTQALVEKHSIRINDFSRWAFPDYALYKDGMYSLRTLGESLLMIPFYLWAKIVSPFALLPYNDLYHPGITSESAIEALTVIGNATFGGFIAVLFFFLTMDLTNSTLSSMVTSLTIGMGTLLWRYGGALQRYPFAIFFYSLALYILIRNIVRHKTFSATQLIFFGMSLGISLLTDLSYTFIVVFFLIAFFLVLYLKKKFSISCIAIVFTAFALPLFILFLYNWRAFGNPFTSAYFYHGVKPHLQDPTIYYAMPLFPSLFINLFQHAPIPPSAFPDALWNNPDIREKESMYWITQYTYRGIFSQTPALFLSLVGFFFLFQKSPLIGFLLFTPPVLYVFQQSKFTFFYAPNSYDSHYFLLAVPLLLVGLGVFMQKALAIKHLLPKSLLLGLMSALIVVSIHNGWYSAITNFAPHVTGEHRFDPATLPHPLLQMQNAWPLLLNTFPNMFNLHVLFLFYFPLYVFLYIGFTKRRMIVRVVLGRRTRKRNEHEPST